MAKYCTLCTQPIRQRTNKENEGLPIGVIKVKNKLSETYKAQIWSGGTNHPLGTYKTVKDAKEAYEIAKQYVMVRGEFNRYEVLNQIKGQIC